MAYLIKAISTSGAVMWVTTPGAEGFRSIGPRTKSESFPTKEDALVAIAKMHQAYTASGVRFSVVRAEGSED
jgi:hypothetical protein